MRTKPKRNILFDGNSLLHQKTGVGHFAERLLVSLADEDVLITVFYFNFLGRYQASHLPIHPNITYKEVRFFPQKVVGLLNRRGIEIPLEFFMRTKGYSFSIFPNFISMPSIRKLPSFTAIHDMSVYDTPQYIQRKNLRFLRALLPRTITRSDAILTISKFTKSRIHHYFPAYPLDNILVVPIPYESNLQTDESVDISSNIRRIAENDKYILHIGTIEPRKNIHSLVEGYIHCSESIKHDYKLVLMGGIGWMSDDLVSNIKLNHSDSIIITGYVNDNERALLYRNASLVCLLSLYEGFGMPILEAGSYNLPLLLSDIPVFREIAGNYALFCNPTDNNDIARSIESALKKSDWNTRRIGENMSWKHNAQAVLKQMNDA